MSTQIATLQDHVATLYNELNVVRSHLGSGGLIPPQQHPAAIDPNLQSAPFASNPSPYSGVQQSPIAAIGSLSPSASRPKNYGQPGPPTFRGPTSSDFNFGVAKSSLKTMGITGQNDGTIEGSGGAGTGTREPSPSAHSPGPTQTLAQQTFHRSKDPIWAVSQEEAIRLCDLFEDEMGLMYPVLDIEKIKDYAKKLYAFMEAAKRTGLMQHAQPGADNLDDEDTSILKLVLATALVTEDGGRSEVGKRMFERVQPALDTLLLEKGNVKGIRMLAMAVSFNVCGHYRNHADW